MSIEEYIEELKMALMNKDKEKVAYLEKSFGDKKATWKDIENAVSYSIYNMTVLIKAFQKEAELKHSNILSVLEKSKVITARQAEDIKLLDKQTEDGIDSFLKGEDSKNEE